MKKWQMLLKKDEKLRLQPCFFAVFCHLLKMAKVAKNGRKVKAIAQEPYFFAVFCPL
jgi:hypothetical protein